jgi:dipeptide transport system ATP-binding protein
MSDNASPVMQAVQLHRHYAARRGLFGASVPVRALNGVSFTLAAGRTLAVVGESGCGKSTLARVLTMVEPPTSGQLLIDGADVADNDAATRRRLRPRCRSCFQNPTAR